MKNISHGIPLAFLTLSVATILVVGVVPVFADGPATTGSRLNISDIACLAYGGTITSSGPTSYCSATTTISANAPFFIRQGLGDGPWTHLSPQERTAFLRSTTGFKLFVDGSLAFSIPYHDYSRSDQICGCDIMSKYFLTNFPSGMTGAHTFEGQWFLDGFFVGGTAGQSVLSEDITISVTFV